MHISNFLLAILFTIVFCGNGLSQNTFFLEDSSFSLVSNYSFPHGFGAEALSQYDPDASFKKACDFALEDLNSNLFLSVYIEQFKTGANSDYYFPELSVRDSVLSFGMEVVKTDSFDVAGQAFCVASLSSKKDLASNTIPDLDKLKIGPIKQNGIWYAMGSEPGSRYNLFVPWIRSKNNALKDLSQTITTLVQSSMISLDYNLQEFTYIKSNVIYNNIVVIRRYISPDNDYVSIVAVKDSDITSY
ncbi:MAG: hypothetical protein WD016_09075 [Balneolaceae bacterium]